MISFVWSSKYPFLAGTGGSENYTAGHIRELQSRGIATRIITIGHGEDDGREDFPDISFLSLSKKEALSQLDDTLVFITYPLAVPTKHQAYAILHCPPLSCARPDPLFDPFGVIGKHLIAPSKFAAGEWASRLGQKLSEIPAVYPFAEKCFSQVKRVVRGSAKKTRILFAGRLTPDKGVYTLLAALHMDKMLDLDYELTATDACSHAEEGKIVHTLFKHHPLINLVPARRNPKEMAALMAEHDIVVVPSTNLFWQETFGIVSIEAQHAGCRVVASGSGGLPETNCGGLVLVQPDNPAALAEGIAKAVALGPLSAVKRKLASRKFTVKESVDTLLATMRSRPAPSIMGIQRTPYSHTVPASLQRLGDYLAA